MITTIRKTYSAGSTSIAVRTIINGTEDTLNWLLSDHLGSASITTTADGTWFSELRYSAFGETRYSSGITSTDYRYTGQLQQADINLYYYNARYYDPALGRFVQSDTMVPRVGSSEAMDRYSYAANNPIIYNDPSGHCYNYSTPEAAARCNAYWASFTKAVKANPDIMKNAVPRKAVSQVDLHAYKSVKQTSYNNCGPWACAGGGPAMTSGSNGMSLLFQLEQAGKQITGRENLWGPYSGGIQPSELMETAASVYGSANVTAMQNATFADIYENLLRGHIVVVDIMATGSGVSTISGEGGSYAHFARVLGIDLDKSEIYLDNTSENDKSYWTVSEGNWLIASTNPEKSVARPADNAETVNQWLLIIDNGK